MDDVTLREWGNSVENILIPNIVVIGVVANLISFFAFLRSFNKSSTNIYLSALAFSDIFLLLFIYVLSLQYHTDINHQSHELYWRMFGLTHWFFNAVYHISTYITVAVACDRYLAIYKPNKVTNDRTRVKNIVSVLILLCFLFTISTAFEYQLKSKDLFVDCTGNPCKSSDVPTAAMQNNEQLDESDNNQTVNSSAWESSRIVNYTTEMASFESSMESSTETETIDEDVNLKDKDNTVNQEDEQIQNEPGNRSNSEKRNNLSCHVEFYLYPSESSMARNTFYRNVILPIKYVVSVFLPLIILITLNCALVTAVCKSNKLQSSTTVNTLERKDIQKKNDSLIVQEHKNTIVLVAVIVIFLICQVPNAFYLLHKSWTGNKQADKKFENVISAIKHFINLTMTINAASKFLIYITLSSQFRLTLKRLFCRCSAAQRQTLKESAQQYCIERKAPKPPNIDELLEYSLQQKLASQAALHEQRHRQSLAVPRQVYPSRNSLTNSEIFDLEMNRRNSRQSIEYKPPQRNSSKNNLLFIPCDSMTNITRSKSLELHSPVKHSPNCKANKF